MEQIEQIIADLKRGIDPIESKRITEGLNRINQNLYETIEKLKKPNMKKHYYQKNKKGVAITKCPHKKNYIIASKECFRNCDGLLSGYDREEGWVKCNMLDKKNEKSEQQQYIIKECLLVSEIVSKAAKDIAEGKKINEVLDDIFKPTEIVKKKLEILGYVISDDLSTYRLSKMLNELTKLASDQAIKRCF